MGKYQLIRKLATGGMAEVFLAKAAGPMGFEKTLVVKRILPHLVEDPAFVEMFLGEAKLAAQLNHANLVQIFDFGTEGGAYFIAMEHVDGLDLRTLSRRALHRGSPLSFPVAARILALSCEGLAYAHELVDPESHQPLGLIHRDISPDNILVSKTGGVKVLDFGIAKAANVGHRTASGVLKGKVSYMAPEYLRGEHIDARADVYALGVVLFELVAGRKPFQADNEVLVIQSILQDPIPDVNTLRPGVPEALVRIIQKALAKRSTERYQSCRELQMDLDRFLFWYGDPVGALQIAELVKAMQSEPQESQPTQLTTTPVPPTTPLYPPSSRTEVTQKERNLTPPAPSGPVTQVARKPSLPQVPAAPEPTASPSQLLAVQKERSLTPAAPMEPVTQVARKPSLPQAPAVPEPAPVASPSSLPVSQKERSLTPAAPMAPVTQVTRKPSSPQVPLPPKPVVSPSQPSVPARIQSTPRPSPRPLSSAASKPGKPVSAQKEKDEELVPPYGWQRTYLRWWAPPLVLITLGLGVVALRSSEAPSTTETPRPPPPEQTLDGGSPDQTLSTPLDGGITEPTHQDAGTANQDAGTAQVAPTTTLRVVSNLSGQIRINGNAVGQPPIDEHVDAGKLSIDISGTIQGHHFDKTQFVELKAGENREVTLFIQKVDVAFRGRPDDLKVVSLDNVPIKGEQKITTYEGKHQLKLVHPPTGKSYTSECRVKAGDKFCKFFVSAE